MTSCSTRKPSTLIQNRTHKRGRKPLLNMPSANKHTNKRGRKPLSVMPTAKKHVQNLLNQRAFRQRRENYVRSLEAKAKTFEFLHAEAQKDVKMLRERLTFLEGRLAKAQDSHDNVESNSYNSISDIKSDDHGKEKDVNSA